MMNEGITSVEAARKVGIHLATLQRWVAAKKLKTPKLTLRGSHSVRLWTQKDIARLRELKKEIYRRGRGRKKKKKA